MISAIRFIVLSACKSGSVKSSIIVIRTSIICISLEKILRYEPVWISIYNRLKSDSCKWFWFWNTFRSSRCFWFHWSYSNKAINWFSKKRAYLYSFCFWKINIVRSIEWITIAYFISKITYSFKSKVYWSLVFKRYLSLSRIERSNNYWIISYFSFFFYKGRRRERLFSFCETIMFIQILNLFNGKWFIVYTNIIYISIVCITSREIVISPSYSSKKEPCCIGWLWDVFSIFIEFQISSLYH